MYFLFKYTRVVSSSIFSRREDNKAEIYEAFQDIVIALSDKY